MVGELPDIVCMFRNREQPETIIANLLHKISEIHNAENVLLIKLEENEELLLNSSTIDGYKVPEATERIPTELVHAALNVEGEYFCSQDRGLPSIIKNEFKKLKQKGAIIYKLGEKNNSYFFLFLENRFCPLETGETSRYLGTILKEALRFSLYIIELNKELAENNEELIKAESFIAEARKQETSSISTSIEKTVQRKMAHTNFIGNYSSIVTASPRMYNIFSVIDKIAHTSASVLIMGNSGTGKELVAKAIHENSPRSNKAFISENCAALTETLLESELFGYVKGAFTGANSDRKGLFELADKGTLFLDEVGDMSLNMQKKLLRVVQEGIIRKVGGKDYIPIDVRIISATNRDLTIDTQKNIFREDLFYRLNVITIELPPLNERQEDIELLTQYFLDELAEKNNKKKKISQEAMELLQSYDWPGNVRELQNEIQRIYTLSGNTIETKNLSEKIKSQMLDKQSFSFPELEMLPLKQAVNSFEREFLRRSLKKFHNNKTTVAKKLKLPKTSLYHKLKKYHL